MTAQETFAGGVAVVTGAGGGIGEGVARAAVAAGMRVVLADVAGDRVETLAREIKDGGGEALAVVTDVADPAALDRLAACTHEAFGDVRLLVNNAGIEMLGHVWDIPAETWDRALRINVLGVINGVRAFAPAMIKAGRAAAIANLSSVGGLGMMPIQTPYIVSKHAVLSFTECLALEMELIGAPVTVSAVLPGPVSTRIFDDAPVGVDRAGVEGHRAYMQKMLRDHGISPLDAGRLILEGLARGDFWVSPHPQMMADAATQRAGYLGGMERPRLTELMRAML